REPELLGHRSARVVRLGPALPCMRPQQLIHDGRRRLIRIENVIHRVPPSGAIARWFNVELLECVPESDCVSKVSPSTSTVKAPSPPVGSSRNHAPPLAPPPRRRRKPHLHAH